MVSKREPGRTPGLIFLGPKGGHGQDGPMILDDQGRIIWFHPAANREEATDFRVQTYKGRPALTWWQGRLSGGEGRGEGVIYSENYRPLTRVRMGNGLAADLHEFELTPQGTALLLAYDTVYRPEGRVTQAVVQEVELDSGLVRFEWHSVGHIATAESFTAQPEGRRPLGLPARQLGRARRRGQLHRLRPPDPRRLQALAPHRRRALAPRRQAQRLHARAGRAVRPPARRPPAAGRLADDLRQQRVAAAAQAVAGDHAAPGRAHARRSRVR